MYEVYICRVDGEVVYIGCGKAGRHQHCTSGCSHVYGLNQLHFKGECVDVEVHKLFSTKMEALDCELGLIKFHRPRLNKVHNGDPTRNMRASDAIKLRKKLLNPSGVIRTWHNMGKYDKLVREFIDFYDYRDIVSGNILIYSRGEYRSIGCSSLANLARYLRNPHLYSPTTVYAKFSERLKECLNLDLMNPKHLK